MRFECFIPKCSQSVCVVACLFQIVGSVHELKFFRVDQRPQQIAVALLLIGF